MDKDAFIKLLVQEIDWAHAEYEKASQYIDAGLADNLLDYLFDLRKLLKEVIGL